MNEQEKPFKHPSFYPGDAPEAEHPFSLYISAVSYTHLRAHET